MIDILTAMETELYKDIIEASEVAYTSIVERNSYYTKENVHRGPVCHMAASILLKHLRSIGYPAFQEKRTVNSGGHSYVVVDNQVVEILGDPTWQQFVSYNPRVVRPRVLVGTRDQVIEQALGFGMHVSHAGFWKPSPIRLIRKPSLATVDQKE
ncbi:hypothetical protein HYW35_03835 [Candidatus Saccharibacteria bacterium]|nr:hypothetical protein [Candidatus Saccharibacteria bacterium]